MTPKGLQIDLEGWALFESADL